MFRITNSLQLVIGYNKEGKSVRIQTNRVLPLSEDVIESSTWTRTSAFSCLDPSGFGDSTMGYEFFSPKGYILLSLEDEPNTSVPSDPRSVTRKGRNTVNPEVLATPLCINRRKLSTPLISSNWMDFSASTIHHLSELVLSGFQID